MKHFRLPRPILALLPVVALSVLVLQIPIKAVPQQEGRGDPKTNSEVTRAASRDPDKPSTLEPSSSQVTKGADRTVTQPSEQLGKNEKKGERSSGNPETQYSWMSVGIVTVMIALLALLFYLQFSYSHRLEQTTYLSEIYVESVKKFELSRLTASLIEGWSKGQYHRMPIESNPPPSIEESLLKLDRELAYGDLSSWREEVVGRLRGGDDPSGGVNRRPTGTRPPPPLPSLANSPNDAERQAKWNEYYNKKLEFQQKLQQWAQGVQVAASKNYDDDTKIAEAMADARAKTAINNTDTSLLAGQGPQFVLEFTAIIVIIFSAVILGVLGKLGDQQIGTLLAAIAGYVLGKASAGHGATAEAKKP